MRVYEDQIKVKIGKFSTGNCCNIRGKEEKVKGKIVKGKPITSNYIDTPLIP